MNIPMDTDDLPVVLPPTTTSVLSLSLHPLPIVNVSEHQTRLRLQTGSTSPFVLGALLGTQNGREIEIVNSFEIAVDEDGQTVDYAFLKSRTDQYKQVFPSLEFIGWYSVAPHPTARHIALHERFTEYCSNPLLLLLLPSGAGQSSSLNSATLPFKAYEATVEIRDRTSRSVFIEVPFKVETGEAERIAVDWCSRGGGGGTSLELHLQTQRAAVKMLHERLLVLVQYVEDVMAGNVTVDHAVLRSLSALIASLPASENRRFREEFDTEFEDVQLTAFLSTLTQSTNVLNDLFDKHLILTSGSEYGERSGGRRHGGSSFTRQGPFSGDWDRNR